MLADATQRTRRKDRHLGRDVLAVDLAEPPENQVEPVAVVGTGHAKCRAQAASARYREKAGYRVPDREAPLGTAFADVSRTAVIRCAAKSYRFRP